MIASTRVCRKKVLTCGVRRGYGSRLVRQVGCRLGHRPVSRLTAARANLHEARDQRGCAGCSSVARMVRRARVQGMRVPAVRHVCGVLLLLLVVGKRLMRVVAGVRRVTGRLMLRVSVGMVLVMVVRPGVRRTLVWWSVLEGRAVLVVSVRRRGEINFRRI